MWPRFRDRREAGDRLAERLRAYANRTDAIVLALPRGGVPVAYEVAEQLRVPLDVFVVRKLGVPGQEELAMGALASGGVRVLDDELIRMAGVSVTDIERATAMATEELSRQEGRYRGARRFPDIRDKTVILVDDGLATGSTMRAAVQALRAQRPTAIVVAVPVGAPETCEALRAVADDVVCVETPEPFRAVGLWYEDFAQTTDDEVHALLDRARHAAPVT
jgi:putative phosphoribosyl transferase